MRSRTPSRPFSRVRVACMAGALALGVASGAHAVAISNLSVAFDPGNTPNLFDDAGPVGAQINSTVGVLSSSATGFVTRYQAGVYTDAGGNGATTNIITLNAAYTISFNVTNAVGSAWRLDLVTSRVGARTGVDDGGGQSAFSLGAVTGIAGRRRHAELGRARPGRDRAQPAGQRRRTSPSTRTAPPASRAPATAA